MADRESDVFEAFALRPEGVDLLIRAAQNRCLDDGGRLFASLDALPEAGRAELELPARPGRKRRTATLAARMASVSLARPKAGLRTGLPGTVVVQVVDVREVDPPPGEAPVHWRLLTTHAMSNAADAWMVGNLYRRRWAIEQLFRTLKTKGFDVEDVQIEHAGAREKLVTATVIAAVAIQQLVHARDGGPDHCGHAPTCSSLRTSRCWTRSAPSWKAKPSGRRTPTTKGSLAYASWVCARLGGWTGYYGKPGLLVMLEGWLEIQAAKRGIAVLSSSHNVRIR